VADVTSRVKETLHTSAASRESEYIACHTCECRILMLMLPPEVTGILVQYAYQRIVRMKNQRIFEWKKYTTIKVMCKLIVKCRAILFLLGLGWLGRVIIL
jgi:hypothetical protein